VAGRRILDGVPLQRVPAAVRVEGVHVLAGRDEPHREGLGDEAVGDLTERPHPEQLRLAEPALIQLGSDRGCADLSKFCEHYVGQWVELWFGHGCSSVGVGGLRGGNSR
jgi:hypothetical protein